MTEHKQFDDQAWEEFGNCLLDKKGSNMQKEFLRICRSGKTQFLQYMQENLCSKKDSIVGETPFALGDKFPVFCENEFLSPPKDTQEIIWNTFKKLSDETAASCGFWGYIIIKLIQMDCIKPEYLAANSNGIAKTGIHIIDKALQSGDKKKIDRCVRRILRSLCNSAPRGKRVVFDDFYFGKAFWRWRWSMKMSESIGLKFEQILTILNEKYYARFSGKMHARSSYISAENIFGGLLLYLEKADRAKITSVALGKIIDRISYLSAWKALEMQSSELNKKEIQAIAKYL